MEAAIGIESMNKGFATVQIAYLAITRQRKDRLSIELLYPYDVQRHSVIVLGQLYSCGPKITGVLLNKRAPLEFAR